MKPEAVAKARDRLRAAESAFEQMRATNIGSLDFDHAWYSFLVAQNSFFSSLEQGAKGGGASKGWFDKKKHERRTDPLLNYLHQARHADEHSLSPVVGRTTATVRANKPGVVSVDEITGKPKLKFTVGEEVKVQFAPSAEILLPVVNRGKTYLPPSAHMGKPLETTYPMKVADLCIVHLRGLLAEAEKLAN